MTSKPEYESMLAARMSHSSGESDLADMIQVPFEVPRWLAVTMTVCALAQLTPSPSNGETPPLTFSAKVSAFKLPNRCLGLNLKLHTTVTKIDEDEWRALVMHVAYQAAQNLHVDFIDVDLRRDGLSAKRDYRDADGLAHYSTNQWASVKCSEDKRHSYLRSARRLMTAKDFEISDRYIKMLDEGANDDQAAKVIGKQYRLPKGWRLPKTEMTRDPIPVSLPHYQPDALSLKAALDLSREAFARIP